MSFSSFSSQKSNDKQPNPKKKNLTLQGPFVDFKGSCLVHPMSSHTWGNSFNNPKNKTLEGQKINTQHDKHHGQGYFYLTKGQGCGQGLGHHFYNAPHLPNSLPTLYIE